MTSATITPPAASDLLSKFRNLLATEFGVWLAAVDAVWLRRLLGFLAALMMGCAYDWNVAMFLILSDYIEIFSWNS